jgi:hypothetical protein
MQDGMQRPSAKKALNRERVNAISHAMGIRLYLLSPSNRIQVVNPRRAEVLLHRSAASILIRGR